MNDNDNSSQTELPNREEIDKLLEEIAIMSAQASRLETKMELFVQKQFVKIGLEHDNNITGYYIPNIQAEFYGELGKLCRNINQMRLVFEINSTEKHNDLYAIEILVDESGHGKLGKTSLPISVDVIQGLLSQYPVDDLNNVKHFLKGCKDYVNSYLCRLEQFKELEDLLSKSVNIDVDHNSDITKIELSVSGLYNISTDDYYNIILYICYEPTAIRPHELKLYLDNVLTYDDKEQSSILKELQKYLNPFLKESLTEGYQKIIKLGTEFEWPPDTKNMTGKSDDESTFFVNLRGDNNNRNNNNNKKSKKKSTN